MPSIKRMLRRNSPLLAMLLGGASLGPTTGATAAQPADAPSEQIVYKRADGRELTLDLFRAANRKANDAGPCVVFFHGGGFQRGNAATAYAFASALAARGLTTVSVNYRLINRSEGATEKPMLDAKSAMRWVRANAARLGCRPDRIAAAGNSAGGTLALLTAMNTEPGDAGDDPSVSPVPNALALLNPGVNLVDRHEDAAPLAFRQKISPLQLLDKTKIPPTLILHGTADKVSPYAEVVKFKDKAVSMGNDVSLIPYDGRGHGFFRRDRQNGRDYETSMNQIADFFKRIGWI